MSDDSDPLDELRRRLDEPLTDKQIERMETSVEFALMTDRGHWCAACGQEQPAQPPCGECYDMKSYLSDEHDEADERRAIVARMTPADLRDLSWLWRS